MQTLVINGSPKADGDTAALVNELVAHLDGEIRIVSPGSNISPCVDCRYCWEHTGCALKDEMQDVYEYLITCDNIVFASPIWFSSLSGPFLNMASRIQSVWAAGYFQKKNLILKEKRGVVILVGAQPETKEMPARAAVGIMKCFHVHRPSVIEIHSLDTNRLPAGMDEIALKKCREAADRLNRSTGGPP
ncbi:MAG: flavodoxin family protein [Oscillospiraceae bacterium]|nr:flavodoxin family protein [Oscillospiraceae bacterium]